MLNTLLQKRLVGMPCFILEVGQNVTHFYKWSRAILAVDPPLKIHFYMRMMVSPVPRNDNHF